MYLIFDTETSGLPKWDLPYEHHEQPVILQIACLLIDENFVERASYYSFVEPCRTDYIIEEGAYNAHGITKEMLEKYGVYSDDVLNIFMELYNRATNGTVAHNHKFDAHLIKCQESSIKFDKSFCTMLASTPICKLPGRGGNYKWPKLQEAYVHMFGQPFDKAHDALADVRATAAVFKWIKQREIPCLTENNNIPNLVTD